MLRALYAIPPARVVTIKPATHQTTKENKIKPSALPFFKDLKSNFWRIFSKKSSALHQDVKNMRAVEATMFSEQVIVYLYSQY